MSINAQLDKLKEAKAQAQALEQQVKREAIAEVRRIVELVGLTQEDVFPINTAPEQETMLITHRHERGMMWNGKGKAPKWIDEAIVLQSPEEVDKGFYIKENTRLRIEGHKQEQPQ